MAICCRAVSSFEHHGPNTNGDGFESVELQKAHHTLVFKGFYIEHKSFNPANAKGLNIHSEFIPWNESDKKGDFVRTISLIDKVMFPQEAIMIRDGLNKNGGVSIGCIAGMAICSECGNIAYQKEQICDCMNRTSGRCIKGKKNSDGSFVGWDYCRNLNFYELTFTANRADRDALKHWVHGSDLQAADPKEFEKGSESFTPPLVQEKKDGPRGIPPSVRETELITINPAMLKQMVTKDTSTAIRQRFHKLVKDIIDRQIGPTIKEKLGEYKPEIQEIVEEKHEEVVAVV